ncbi:MAG TPA: hypothetical protein DCF48_08325 [Rikenellaceae bacterium]|nr:hypothetical protein [Rikenellaceae bacterium]
MRTYNGIERQDFTPDMISELKADEVFVFGSNLEGMHGGGAAFAGFRDKEIAPLFSEAVGLENVCLPESFVKALK